VHSSCLRATRHPISSWTYADTCHQTPQHILMRTSTLDVSQDHVQLPYRTRQECDRSRPRSTRTIRTTFWHCGTRFRAHDSSDSGCSENFGSIGDRSRIRRRHGWRSAVDDTHWDPCLVHSDTWTTCTFGLAMNHGFSTRHRSWIWRTALWWET